MDVFRPNLSGQNGTGILRPLDPRLQPTPDYGTLGPGSDLAPAPVSRIFRFYRRTVSNLRLLHIGAMMAGIGLAVAVSSAGGIKAVWGKLSTPFRCGKILVSLPARPSDIAIWIVSKPQKQAEILLERAMARSDGATGRSKRASMPGAGSSSGMRNSAN